MRDSFLLVRCVANAVQVARNANRQPRGRMPARSIARRRAGTPNRDDESQDVRAQRVVHERIRKRDARAQVVDLVRALHVLVEPRRLREHGEERDERAPALSNGPGDQDAERSRDAAAAAAAERRVEPQPRT